jgi:hypothetical protein
MIARITANILREAAVSILIDGVDKKYFTIEAALFSLSQDRSRGGRVSGMAVQAIMVRSVAWYSRFS